MVVVGFSSPMARVVSGGCCAAKDENCSSPVAVVVVGTGPSSPVAVVVAGSRGCCAANDENCSSPVAVVVCGGGPSSPVAVVVCGSEACQLSPTTVVAEACACAPTAAAYSGLGWACSPTRVVMECSSPSARVVTGAFSSPTIVV